MRIFHILYFCLEYTLILVQNLASKIFLYSFVKISIFQIYLHICLRGVSFSNIFKYLFGLFFSQIFAHPCHHYSHSYCHCQHTWIICPSLEQGLHTVQSSQKDRRTSQLINSTGRQPGWFNSYTENRKAYGLSAKWSITFWWPTPTAEAMVFASESREFLFSSPESWNMDINKHFLVTK